LGTPGKDRPAGRMFRRAFAGSPPRIRHMRALLPADCKSTRTTQGNKEMSLPASAGRAARLPVLLAAAVAIGLAAASPGHAADRPLAERPVPMIRVQGEGSVAVAPDMAIIDIGVLREGATAREALTASNEAMAAVIAAMKEEGIEARDLQTSGFFVQPRYTQPAPDRSSEAPRIDGYSATNSLTVRIRDLARLGAVLDRAVTLGVNTGGNITFTNAEPDQHVAKAREAAVRDAAARARQLAEAAGVKLGNLVEINDMGSGPRPMMMARAKSFDAAEAVPVESGENTYTVNIQAAWEVAE